MAFTVRDYHDLVRLLGDHPEWRVELRRLLIEDELAQIRAIMRETQEIQSRSEQRLTRLESAVQKLESAVQKLESSVQALVAAHERSEQRLTRLESAVQALVVAQERTQQTVQELVEAQKRTELHVTRMDNDLAHLKGWALEARYRERAPSYFGRWLCRIRIVEPTHLEAVQTALDDGRLTDSQWVSLTALDALLRGKQGRDEGAFDVYMALEVSATIALSDVERAYERAQILQHLGYHALGGVGGIGIMAEARERAEKLGVAIALDGRVDYWPSTPTA